MLIKTFECCEKDVKQHRVTISPSEERVTIKYMAGTGLREIEELKRVTQRLIASYENTKTTLRFRVAQKTMEITVTK